MTNRFTNMLKISSLAVAAGLALAAAGCSSSNSLSGQSDLIRSVDAVADGGNATIDINSGTVQGDQTFFTTSPYLFINPGLSNFTFLLSANESTTYPTVNSTLAGNSHYTVILTGQAAVTMPSDVRYPKVIVLQDDQSLPAAGNGRVRIVNTAPDAGAVDVYVNSVKVFSNVAYATASGYIDLPSGSATVSVNEAGTGTVIAPSTPITVPSGGATSLFATEPTVTPAIVYGVQQITDF